MQMVMSRVSVGLVLALWRIKLGLIIGEIEVPLNLLHVGAGVKNDSVEFYE